MENNEKSLFYILSETMPSKFHRNNNFYLLLIHDLHYFLEYIIRYIRKFFIYISCSTMYKNAGDKLAWGDGHKDNDGAVTDVVLLPGSPDSFFS